MFFTVSLTHPVMPRLFLQNKTLVTQTWVHADITATCLDAKYIDWFASLQETCNDVNNQFKKISIFVISTINYMHLFILFTSFYSHGFCQPDIG